jgi:hypothetical protein
MVKLLQGLDTVLGLPTLKPAVVQSTGTNVAGEPVGLDSHGKLDVSVLPDGVGARTRVLEASGALSANDLVNAFYDASATKWKVRRASAASLATACTGFVKDAVSDGENATVYLDGTFDVDPEIVAGLPHVGLYLSAVTPGKPSAYSAEAAIFQVVGYLVDTNVAEFQLTPGIVQITS